MFLCSSQSTCLSWLSLLLINQFIVNAATAALATLFDTLILMLTIAKTWHHVVEMRRLGRTGLMEVFLRDGEQHSASPA